MDLMETGSFDEATFEREVRLITALPDGSLEVQFFDGQTKRWEMPPKPVKPPKAPAKKRPTHIFDGKIFCGKCGRRFGRVISERKDRHLTGTAGQKPSRSDLRQRELSGFSN